MRLAGFLTVLLILSATTATASEERRADANRGAVGLIIDAGASSDATLATDLVHLLNGDREVRVLPVLGEGSVQSIEDLLYLRGIDIAMVHADVLDFLRQDGLVDDVKDQIRYVARIAADEVHVLARRSIGTIDDLKGQRVNFGPEDSGGFLTAGFIFEQLGIDVDVTAFDPVTALSELQDGTIDAAILVEAAPVASLRSLRAGDQLHFLDLPKRRLADGSYRQARLLTEDYPGLIDAGQAVETVSVAEVLTAYNWPPDHPRGRNVAAFVEGLIDNFDRLTKPPFHPNWREVDLREPLEGWTRLGLVDDLLNRTN